MNTSLPHKPRLRRIIREHAGTWAAAAGGTALIASTMSAALGTPSLLSPSTWHTPSPHPQTITASIDTISASPHEVRYATSLSFIKGKDFSYVPVTTVEGAHVGCLLDAKDQQALARISPRVKRVNCADVIDNPGVQRHFKYVADMLGEVVTIKR